MIDKKWFVKHLIVKLSCLSLEEVNKASIRIEYYDRLEDCAKFCSITLFDKQITIYGVDVHQIE